MQGEVVRGDQLGRSWGFPTANLRVHEKYKLIPNDGIYACRVRWQGQLLEGMMYIGVRPTINGIQRNIEVNIFDFDQQIYGEQLEVLFVSQIRDDMKFESIELLKAQLGRDKQQAMRILSELPA